MAEIRIGISGWRYAGWRGVFYPPELPQKRELEYASRALSTIEINGSHYALQTPASYHAWYEATPPGFVFSVKAPRYVTHILRLKDERSFQAIINFFASGLFNLREKLGPILWQFPPSLRFDEARFDAFLRALPADTEAAAALARRHDEHVRNVQTAIDASRRMRHAIEIRNDSFCDERFIDLLRKHKAALVISDAVADWPYAEDMTADFTYMRLHGAEVLYGGEYTDAALDRWAQRVQTWSAGGEPPDAQRIAKPARQSAGRDVYCYFDNDQKVRAPFDAARLMNRLRGHVPPGTSDDLQRALWSSVDLQALLKTHKRPHKTGP
ncbi:MAG TPA: DUF72 domain-containing protein [Oxalicibacterium sp.]|jgi:uncharacterized protein YecE (DUF72 family)|nr:DUF72 domain-containing protein [Oxalicibacterium sp.]